MSVQLTWRDAWGQEWGQEQVRGACGQIEVVAETRHLCFGPFICHYTGHLLGPVPAAQPPQGYSHETLLGQGRGRPWASKTACQGPPGLPVGAGLLGGGAGAAAGRADAGLGATRTAGEHLHQYHEWPAVCLRVRAGQCHLLLVGAQGVAAAAVRVHFPGVQVVSAGNRQGPGSSCCHAQPLPVGLGLSPSPRAVSAVGQGRGTPGCGGADALAAGDCHVGGAALVRDLLLHLVHAANLWK